MAMYKKYEDRYREVIVFHEDDPTQNIVFVICQYPTNDETITAINDALGTSITGKDLKSQVPADEAGDPEWGATEDPLMVGDHKVLFVWFGLDAISLLTWLMYWQKFLTQDQLNEICLTTQSYFM